MRGMLIWLTFVDVLREEPLTRFFQSKWDN